MAEIGCTKIIFSSSATVYQPVASLEELPLDEDSPTGQTTNPYARSKLHVEEMLRDAVIANRFGFKLYFIILFHHLFHPLFQLNICRQLTVL